MNRITYHILPLIKRTLDSAPVNWRDIFKQAGLPFPSPNEAPPAYVEMENVLEAFAIAANQADDDHLVIRHFDPRGWYFYPTLYSGLVSLSNSFGDFMATYRRYGSLHTDNYHRLRFHERGGYIEVEFEMLIKHPGSVQFLDFQLLLLTIGVENLSGHGFPGLKLDLVRKQCEEPLYHIHYPDAKIRCGMPSTRVYGDTELLNRRFQPDNPRLPSILQERAEREVREVENESSLRRDLRVLMVGTLEHGMLNSEFAARQLGMSRRTLTRKLQAEGVTFQQILDEFRHENSLRFLVESNRDLEEIAQMLGFSEERSFRRFFQTAEGMTPLKYRKKYKK